MCDYVYLNISCVNNISEYMCPHPYRLTTSVYYCLKYNIYHAHFILFAVQTSNYADFICETLMCLALPYKGHY